jgi:hypothetical protein
LISDQVIEKHGAAVFSRALFLAGYVGGAIITEFLGIYT